ncbi:MAG: adenylate/guanylate cyclase domain-containing protein [Pseudanabaena sp. ELA607]
MNILSLCRARLHTVRNPLGKLRLRTTIVVPFVIQIVATVTMVSYLSFRNGQRSINTLVDNLNGEISNRIEQQVISYLNRSQDTLWLTNTQITSGNLDLNDFDKLRRYFWQVVHQGDFEGYLSYGNERGEFVGVEYQENGPPQLKIRTSATAPMREIYLLNAEGEKAKFIKSANYDPRDRPWYKAAAVTHKPTWSEIYPFFSSKNTVLGISPVYPILDQKQQLIGVLCINVRLTRIRDFLTRLTISPNGQSFIMERSGNLVASSTIAQPFGVIGSGEERTIERMAAERSTSPIVKYTTEKINQEFGNLNNITGGRYLKFQNEQNWYYAKVSPIRDNRGIDWLLVVVVPESDFMEQINRNTRDTIMLSILALMVAIIVGIRTTQWITRPLLRLSKTAQQISEGDLTQKAGGSVIVEIETLSSSFNSMIEQLSQSFTDLRHSQESLRLANEELELRVERRTQELRREKERSERLLLNVLPASIATRLKETNQSPAEQFEEATILFADIVGFTSLSARMEPMELVSGLNEIFSAFDNLTEKYGLEKIKTIGDAYMVVGGLPLKRTDHAMAVADIALEMQAFILNNHSLSESVQLRIGINTGPVIAGVIGIKKFIYDLWGDAVNVASRMESHGKPGYIQVTDATYQQLKDAYILEPRGTVIVKGRGEMTTYWLLGKNHRGEN